MKNKKTLWILIPLVLGIWGLILWKLLDYSSEDTSSSIVTLTYPESIAEDTAEYVLALNYRDPFLRSSWSPGTTKPATQKTKKNNIRKVNIQSLKGPEKPAELKYKGAIQCNNSRIGLLEVAGERKLVSENTTLGQYAILKVEDDSLRISYMDKEFSYGKE